MLCLEIEAQQLDFPVQFLINFFALFPRKIKVSNLKETKFKMLMRVDFQSSSRELVKQQKC